MTDATETTLALKPHEKADGAKSRSLWTAVGTAAVILGVGTVLALTGAPPRLSGDQWMELAKYTGGMVTLGYGGINLGQRALSAFAKK